MLLETAIGDAYGAAFEYVNPRFVRENNNLRQYYKHPRHGIEPGCYTDDAQMSIAIAEAMLDPRPWSPAVVAEFFVLAFKRDPREGYAGGFYDFLTQIGDHEQFLAQIRPHSDKSGAAMRAAPLGVLPTTERVTEHCRVQAAITHATPDGIKAACAAALMSHYFIFKLGPKADLGAFLDKHVAGEWSEPWSGKVGAKGWMSVRAAITAIMRERRMSELLKSCVDYGGDVDTVAAIALAAASSCDEYDHDIPQELVDGLENGPYGRSYLIELDERLQELKSRLAM